MASSRSEVSTRLKLTGQKNPFHSTAGAFVQKSAFLQQMHEKIYSLAREKGLMITTTHVDLPSLIHELGDDFLKIVDMFSKAKQLEPELRKPVLEPPPTVKEQYSRIEKKTKDSGCWFRKWLESSRTWSKLSHIRSLC